MTIKRYSKKEPVVLLWIMAPYVFFLNLLLFGRCIFTSFSAFGKTFLASGIYIMFVYFIFGIIALGIQKRFPAPGEMFRRIGVMLPVFYGMNAISISVILYVYEHWISLPCPARAFILPWAIIYACIMSTIITFINEGVANWESWKLSITEAERRKNVFQRSKILGLRGQVNPHFLFNCFNTLSGLIQEDETKAEKFLDEMTKVHRYLLRTDDDNLVSVEEELKFARSYLYLAHARFGDSILASLEISGDVLMKRLPPLTLQVVLENIIYSNALRKDNPLSISIFGNGETHLAVRNNIQQKSGVPDGEAEDGLVNLVKKYKILGDAEVVIEEDPATRTLYFPLFEPKENGS